MEINEDEYRARHGKEGVWLSLLQKRPPTNSQPRI
jgi:hypothetical protein